VAKIYASILITIRIRNKCCRKKKEFEIKGFRELKKLFKHFFKNLFLGKLYMPGKIILEINFSYRETNAPLFTSIY
jgi:hypothetical protein